MEPLVTPYTNSINNAPTSQINSDVDVMSLLMPQRTIQTRSGRRRVCILLSVLTIGMVALFFVATGGVCFFDRGHACYFYLAPIENAVASMDYDARNWWRLL